MDIDNTNAYLFTFADSTTKNNFSVQLLHHWLRISLLFFKNYPPSSSFSRRKPTTVDFVIPNVWRHQSPSILCTTVDLVIHNIWRHQPPSIMYTTVDLVIHNVWRHHPPPVMCTTVDLVTHNVWRHQPPRNIVTVQASLFDHEKRSMTTRNTRSKSNKKGKSQDTDMAFDNPQNQSGPVQSGSGFETFNKSAASPRHAAPPPPSSGSHDQEHKNSHSSEEIPYGVRSSGSTQNLINPLDSIILNDSFESKVTSKGLPVPAINKQAINKWLYDTGVYLSNLQADSNSSLPTPPPTVSVMAWLQFKKKLPLLDNLTPRQRDPIVRRMVKILDTNVQTVNTCVTDTSSFLEGVKALISKLDDKLAEYEYSIRQGEAALAEEVTLDQQARMDEDLRQSEATVALRKLHEVFVDQITSIISVLESIWLPGATAARETLVFRQDNSQPPMANPPPPSVRRHSLPPHQSELDPQAAAQAAAGPSRTSRVKQESPSTKPATTTVAIPDDPLLWNLASIRDMTRKQRGLKFQNSPVEWINRRYPSHDLILQLSTDRDYWPEGWSSFIPEVFDRDRAVRAIISRLGGVQLYREFMQQDRDEIAFCEEALPAEFDLKEGEVGATVNWTLTGWHEKFLDGEIQERIVSWPIHVKDGRITINNHGPAGGGHTIRSATFSTVDTPKFLWDLVNIRAFPIDDAWCQLEIAPHRRGDHLRNEAMVFMGSISKHARSIFHALDFPRGVETYYRGGDSRYSGPPIYFSISMPRVQDRWGTVITQRGEFRIAFRDPLSRDRYLALKTEVPLTLTEVAGLGKVDTITKQWDEELGPYPIKWLWFQRDSSIHQIRGYLDRTFGKDSYQGVRRNQPRRAVFYVIGFLSERSRQAFARTVHKLSAPPSLYPMDGDLQVVELAYKIPMGYCFRCFHPDFKHQAKGHVAKHCTFPVCNVCKHHTHLEAQCGYVARQGQVVHRSVQDRLVLDEQPRTSVEDAASVADSVYSTTSVARRGIGPSLFTQSNKPAGRKRKQRAISPGSVG